MFLNFKISNQTFGYNWDFKYTINLVKIYAFGSLQKNYLWILKTVEKLMWERGKSIIFNSKFNLT